MSKKRARPARLSWGGGGNVSTTLETQVNNRNNDTWIDRFAPKDIKELCVAPKKIKQVQEWLEKSERMLIMVGSPGIGKSTMVKLVCTDAQEWIEEPGCENALDSFVEFLRHTSYSPGVVLIDELPYLHTDDQKARFRQAFQRHVEMSPRKTIWVYSATQGGQHRPKELEALLDPQVLYHSGLVTIMQINAVTNAKMKKIITGICKSQKLRVPSDLSIYNGDLRHALLSTQFSATSSSQRDTRLSPFHALGKLLYAKREESSDAAASGRPPLQFDPEQVVEQSGMPLQASIYFLQGHAPDFFADVSEISRAFERYSDATLFMDQTMSLMQYATSLASRATATENHHPAPTKFRSFSSPPIFEVRRKANENRASLEMLHSIGEGSFSTFATDDFPYLRRIHPNASLNLNSMVNSGGQATFKAEAERKKLEEKEQEEILAMDDIEDFSD